MKITSLLLVASLFALVGLQAKVPYGDNNNTTFYSSPMIEDQKAHFPGGEEKMQAWIKENLKYPEGMKKYGTVHLEFTVKKNGTLSKFVVKKGLSEDANLSAIDCLSGMPKWEPAIEEGKKTDSRVSVQVRFIRE